MRRGTWTWLCVTIGLAIGVPFCLVVGSVIAGYLYLRGTVEEIDAAEREMQQPAFYQPVVRDLALFCQTYGSAFQDAKITEVEKAWLPDSAQKLSCWYCAIGSDYLSLEFGGGFHHFGYNIILDKRASNPTERIWRLSFYSEDKNNDEPIELTTIGLSSSAMCSDFLRTALAHYRQETSKSPKDLSIYQHQLLFCMKFAQYDEAVQSLERAEQNLPEDWWPQFALDVVGNRLGNRLEQNRFERWVHDHPTYLSYACLVWLYKLENDPSEAAKAGKMMLQFVPRDDPPFNNNFCAWTEDVSVYLYHSGHHDLAADLCRKIEPELNHSRNKVYASWLQTFQRLDAAFSEGSATKDSAPERSGLTKMIFLRDDIFEPAPAETRLRLAPNNQ
jgi:tetratricopeptide (TPR) repeat protein